MGKSLLETQNLSRNVFSQGNTTQFQQCHQLALSDLYQTSIRIHPLYHYHPKTIILIIAITSQHHTISIAAHLEPHRLLL